MKSFRFLIFAALILAGCNRRSLQLDYTNAQGEVQPIGNLVFRFDKPLVADSLVNRWDSTPYIRFEPAIRGKFRWEHPYELVFSPEKALPPATRFTATLTSELLQYSTFSKIEKADNLQFHTPDLKLESNNVTWVAREDHPGSALPQVDLYFNYPVDPAKLKDKLQLTIEGKAAAYRFISLSSDSRLSLQLTGIQPEDKDIPITVLLQKGLVPDGGESGMPEDFKGSIVIPSPYNLTINEVNANHDGVSGSVYVRTSQQVMADQLQSYISFEPALKFTVETTDDGFVINSDHFDASRSYLLSIRKGVKGNIGGILREQYDKNIAFGELEPSISFARSKAVYLSQAGNRNIEVRIVNVPRVKVIISKIYENNLLAARQYGYYPKDESSEDSYWNDGGGDLQLGDVVYEKEIDTRTLPKYGNSRLFRFDPGAELADFKGIYHIKIRSATDYWVSDSRFISQSDLGLIAREGKDKLVVFVNSIQRAQPVSGVNVLAYGSNNQILGLGTTDEQGVAEIKWTKREYDGFKPAMIIAKTASDFNYLPFQNTRVNTSRFDVGGRRSNASGLDAYIYPERDIYRPGETLHYSVIIRDGQWKSPGQLPVKLKFLLPDGKDLREFRKMLNEQGSLEGDLDLPVSAITGTYTLEVYNSTDILLGSQLFQVEEFVPDRIRVNARLDHPVLEPGQEARLSVQAENFFGPPAANRNVEYEIQTKQKSFRAAALSGYDFDLENIGVSFDKTVGESKTDAEGKVEIRYRVPENYENNGILQANFFTTVFDETGRPVSRLSQADIYTQPLFFGIAVNDYWYHPLNQVIRFPLIAADRNGKLLSGVKAQVSVIKHEYRTVLKRSGSYFRYESQKEDKLLASQTLTVNDRSSIYSFVPRSPGSYELRVAIPGAGSYVKQEFYSYGRWGGENSSFEVNAEGNIDIQLDKQKYETGETVKALFKTPFSGRMLVTLERDRLISYQYVDVANRSASVDLKMTAEDLPNVFITATLIKPHEVSDMPLTVAHGFQNVIVEEKDRKIPVQVMAEKTVRSRTKQKVTIKAMPYAYVTLAAVDNGVLQVSGFESPDPYKHFYASRALEVNSYDLYPLLFPELQATLSSTGGDGDIDMKKRTNPMPAKRIKILSYWSGIRQANGSGEVSFDLDIPAFSGEVRLMAVAYKDQRFGSSEAAMKVADPIVLSTALPRFLSPEDTVTVPVTITNTTARSTEVQAKLELKGPLRVLGENSRSVSLPANSEGRAEFRLVANKASGAGTVSVDVNGLGEHFRDETEIGVRPASPLQVRSGSGVLAGGQTARLSIETNDFLPGTTDYRLSVSRNLSLELGKAFRYLLQYPYGCTEQTVSIAFPQLYYSDLARQIGGKTLEAGSAANDNIITAIRKIRLRQLYNGAITLWDGEGTENWWATVYAAHFLLEARKAGFDVDPNVLNGILDYLSNRLRAKESIVYYYNDNQQKKIAPKEVAYSLYVLALAGRPNIPAMNYYKANSQLLSLDSRYLLSVSYAIAGDKQRFRELLPGSFSGEVSVAQTGGSFYSPIRDEAIALNALVDYDPDNSQVPLMERHVADMLKNRDWYSTQECAFSFIALGKLARKANQSDATAIIKSGSKVLGRMEGKTITLSSRELGSTDIQVQTAGSGRLYYFWESEGVSASGTYPETDNYLRVHKRFFDRFGKPLTGFNFKQNQLIIVQVSVEKMYSGSIDNVVITDLLPAGFEIENPRTKEIPGMDWIKDASTPTSLDVRDDRINFFVNLRKSEPEYFYYAVRAVSPGIYRMGPVSAEAMYRSEYHSYHDAALIRIDR